jgi:hypothetical protein
MDAGKMYLVWTHYGVQAEAWLNVPGRKLIVIDPSSGVRGPLIYDQTSRLRAIFETTTNYRSDVYRFIDEQKPTMLL